MSEDTRAARELRTLLGDADVGSVPRLDPQAIMRAGTRRRRWRQSAMGAGAAIVLGAAVVAGSVLHKASPRHVAPPAASATSSPDVSASPSIPHALASPDGTGEPAKGCDRDPDPVVTFTINPDGPMPSIGCAIVGKTQRLRIVNATNAFNQPGRTITLLFAGLPPRTLRVGESTTYEMPFGNYLAPGQHWLHEALYGNQIIVDIWLQ